jgi:hypothetical protein
MVLRRLIGGERDRRDAELWSSVLGLRVGRRRGLRGQMLG